VASFWVGFFEAVDDLCEDLVEEEETPRCDLVLVCSC